MSIFFSLQISILIYLFTRKYFSTSLKIWVYGYLLFNFKNKNWQFEGIHRNEKNIQRSDTDYNIIFQRLYMFYNHVVDFQDCIIVYINIALFWNFSFCECGLKIVLFIMWFVCLSVCVLYFLDVMIFVIFKRFTSWG